MKIHFAYLCSRLFASEPAGIGRPEFSLDILPRRGKVRVVVLVLLALMACWSRAGTVTWDGGGEDLSWHNPLNWSGDQVPGEGDDVVIDVPTNVTITCDGLVSIRSVQCRGGLLIGGYYNSFALSGGSSIVDGALTLQWRRNLSVGAGAFFASKGPTTIEGSVYASGSVVLLTNATSLMASNGNITICAQGAGAWVDLSRVTNISSVAWYYSDYNVNVAASGGGQVDLRRARIAGNCFSASARGAGSVVDMSTLSGEWGSAYRSSLSALDGGSLLFPNVTGLTNVNLTLSTNGASTSQLRSIRGGTLSVSYVAPDFGNLTNIDGSGLSGDNGAFLNLSNVTRVASLPQVSAYSGASVLLTNLTSLVASQTLYCSASGPGLGGVIDLSGVTNLALGNWYLYASAYSGGRVDLSRASITGNWSYVQAVAEGTGSIVDFSALKGEWGLSCGAPSLFQVRDGGAILVPNVTALTNVSLGLLGTNRMPIAQLRSIRRGIVPVTLLVAGCAPDLSNLTNVDGSTLQADQGGTLDLNRVTAVGDFRGASAYGGSVVRLTNVATLVLSNGYDMNFAAADSSSLMDLSRVRNVLVQSGILSLTAGNGGRVDLSQARIAGNQVYASAFAPGSVVDLSALSGEWGTMSGSTLMSRDGGTVWIPNVTGLTNLALWLWNTNGTPVSQIRSIRRGMLRVWGCAPVFTQLTNLDGTGLDVDYEGQLDLGGVRSIQGFRGASVNRNGTVLLTNLSSLAVTDSDLYLSLGGGGGGGLVDLSGVTNIVVVETYRSWQASAYNGARLSLSRVETITGGGASFLADGAGTIIDLSRLSGFLTPLRASSLKAQNGGVILLNSSAVYLLANVAVTLPGLITQASPAMVLHALPWHSYWVEQRDTRQPDSPWTFVARVPMTSTLQTFAPAPSPDSAFRVWEFVGDPATGRPILDMSCAGAQSVQMVLYAMTNQTCRVLTSTAVDDPVDNWVPWGADVLMTNSFRIVGPMPGVEAKRFFRAHEL